MKNTLGVDAKTVIRQITLVRCGMGSNIELFSYQSPDQKVVQPKNSDIGGYHIAFYVDDIKAAANDLHAKNVKTMMGPIPITEGPAAGQAIVYFNAPWGLRLEAISYPKGMAYEKDAATILWTPRPGQVRLTYFTDSLCSTVLDSRARTLARSSRFGFSWLAAISLRKPRLLTVGFPWISLDSLVRIETYQRVTRDFR